MSRRCALLICCLGALSSPGCAVRLTEPTLTEDVPDWLLDIVASESQEMLSDNEQLLSREGFGPPPEHPRLRHDLMRKSCPWADMHTLSAFKAIFSDWQGKRIAVAGDSLTDSVFEALLCSAKHLGANDTLKASRTFYVKQDGSTASYNVDHPLRIARTLKQADFVEHEITVPGLRPVTVAHRRFYDFDDGLPGHSQHIYMIKWNTLFDGASFDAFFMNMAHSALYYGRKDTATLVGHAIRQAAARRPIQRFVIFGHPPQHFDTPSGAYTQDATKRKCQCKALSQMMGQSVWVNNAAAKRVARQLQVPFVDPWDDYAGKCNDHRPSDVANFHDCTHFSSKLDLHLHFLKRLFGAART